MPNLTVTLTDAQVNQVKEALTTQDVNGVDVVPTQDGIASWLKTALFSQVRHNEQRKAAVAHDPAASLRTAGW